MNSVFSTLFLLHFLNDGIRTAFISLLPFVAKDLHMTLTQVGLLGSSQGLLNSILSLPAGFIAARIGGLRILFISLLVYSLGAAIIGVSPTLFIFFPVFYLAESGFGMFHTIGWSLVARSSQKTNIGRSLGNFTAIGDIGRIVIPAIAIFITSVIGWRRVFLGLALLGCFCYVIFQFMKHRNSDAHSELVTIRNESFKAWRKHILQLLRQKNLLLILTAGVIDNLAGNSVLVFLPFFLLARGVTSALLGIFIGGFFLGSLAGKWILGRSLDKFGNAKVFILAELMMACSLVLLTLFHYPVLLLFISLLLGLFTRGTTPVVASLFSEVTHQVHYEKVYALSETFLGIMGAFAPTIMGIFGDKLGIVSIFYASAFFASLAVVPIIILVSDLFRS